MKQLDVINLMLGTMGEKPLNSLQDSHALLSAALGKLDEKSRSIQARGWWFNQEEITLTPSSLDSGIYLPNDALSVQSPSYSVVKRGNRLYNLKGGSFVFTAPVAVQLKRQVAFEDLDDVAASYISAAAILQFQIDYDGDTIKARMLREDMLEARTTFMAEHTRQRKVNFIDSSYRLQRLKSFTRNVRAGI